MKTWTSQKVVFRDTQAVIAEETLPEPGDNQVLIRTSASLISLGTEKAALMRVWDDANFRENPGYALAGEVIAAGKNEAGLAPGDRVVSLVNHAAYALASADPWVTLKIPDGVRDDEAVFLPLASVALHAVRRAQIQLGDAFLIIGLGIIGQIAVSLAKMQGARQIIAMDLVEGRLVHARQRGADETVLAGQHHNPGQEDAVEKIIAMTGGEGVPVILDSTGNNRVIPQAFKMAALGGRIVTVGIINEEVSFHFYREFMQRELSLIAASQPRCPTNKTIYWRWTQQANRQLLLEMMASGKLCVGDLLTHRFDAAESPQVYERIKENDKDMLGVLLEWR